MDIDHHISWGDTFCGGLFIPYNGVYIVSFTKNFIHHGF